MINSAPLEVVRYKDRPRIACGHKKPLIVQLDNIIVFKIVIRSIEQTCIVLVVCFVHSRNFDTQVHYFTQNKNC